MDRRRMLDRAAESIAAWNRGDAEGVVVHMVADVIWYDIALPMPLHGPHALVAAADEYLIAFPDLRVEVTSRTLEGPRLVEEWTSVATHRGELLGMPPTGRMTKTYGATALTFDEDGMIIEGSTYWNPLAMLSQLGLLQLPEPAVVK
jgi:steroid delta-isomerase-like uncharacterized protein